MSIILDGTTGITTPAETVSGAVTAATVTATGLISGATNYTGFKNRIINGAMVIDQRNAGASVTITTSDPYITDRWNTVVSQNSKCTAQQNAGSVTPPIGFTNYLGITSSSAYSVLSGDYFLLRQRIEGFNTADLGWGTASAAAITVSFWVRSSLTGTFGGALENAGDARSYPFSYTISASNTWEQKTITIAGDTSGTWLTNNGIGVELRFSLGGGSTYSGTANAWQAGNFIQPTGATSVVSTNGATFYITGVQLELGAIATSFDYRPYNTELDLCQRYFQLYGANGGSVFGGSFLVRTGFLTLMYGAMSLVQKMRTSSPTLAYANNLTLTKVNGTGYATQAVTVVAIDISGDKSCSLRIDVASNWLAGDIAYLSCDATGYVSFSAEL